MSNESNDLSDALDAIAVELGRPNVKVYRTILPHGTHSVGFPTIARKFYPGEMVARLARCGFVLYPRSRAERAHAAKRARHAKRPNGRAKGR